ncbi:MAG: lamin tail domain-containing protein [Planctomycetes bacterium]|nr:lamin tail domain-containing protein [Planctomycetota bacterium]
MLRVLPHLARERFFLFIAAMIASARPAAGVVISEIHYHPPLGQENLEFVELANDSSTPEDLSGWAFVEGLKFVFPHPIILPGKGFLVVCADAGAVKARYGLQDALGNFTGLLDNGGEKIVLVNPSGIVIQSVTYGDNGKWPVIPDGTGHTLALRDVHLDPGEPESWSASAESGGTPGKANFASSEPSFIEQVIIDRGATWRYQKGTAAFSAPEDAWRQPDFNDASWPEGPSGFGYGDGDDATELGDMLNGYLAVAIRKKFQLSAAQLAAPGDFYLGMNYDDGFLAFLNGAELARANCGAPGAAVAWNAAATGAREAGPEDVFLIPRGLLEAGDNVLAIDGHNFSLGSSDFSLIPRLMVRQLVTSNPSGSVPVIFNELFRGTSGSGWVELYNAGPAAFDLTGFKLADDPDRPDPYLFPPGTSIAAKGFLTVPGAAGEFNLQTPKVRFFLIDPAGLTVSAASFDKNPPAGVQEGLYSEARFPDGSLDFWITLTPTPGAANRVQRNTDIVINEIFYHPPEERRGEFIELYNLGSQPVDVSGFRFNRGLTYSIPAGTVLAPGSYLVIAEDPALLERNYGLSGVLGPYEGALSNSGENLRLVDLLGNIADEVRYYGGGAWSHWADGRGSSLELIDPDQDNAVGAAWEASDETQKAQWEELKYSVSAYTPAVETELHLFLAERGICLIDDLSITRAGGANMIPNPGFEASTAGWRIEGTHVHSQRITYDKRSGAACLELAATGKGDTGVNRIEADTSPKLTAGPYDVSLWARWRRGTSLIICHGEFTPGPFGGRPSPAENISGNTLGGRLRMTVPLNLGTPGAENSASKALRAQTGGANLGPVISEVKNSPPSPAPNAPIKIAARVSDSDGVAGVSAMFRLDNASGPFTAVPLRDDGQSEDGEAGDGWFGGALPAPAAGAKVVFYVEAADARGAARRFPVEAPSRTLLCVVEGPVNDPIDSARYYLDGARTQELQSRPLHSNDLLDGTFVFNNDEIYYHIGVRYRGSPWGRPSLQRYRVRFQKDRLFHRGLNDINLGNSGGAPNEGSAYFLVGRAGTETIPSPATDYLYVRGRFNGASFGTQSLLQTVDNDFMNQWYGEGAPGPVLKAVGRLQFNDAGQRAIWDGASYIHMGNITENYRGYFSPAMRQTADVWDPLFQLTLIMDRRKTTNTIFDEQIDSILDVEAFLRGLAPNILMAGWDAFSVGNGHNGYLAYDGRDGRWELLSFDMDNTFSSPNSNLFATSDGDVTRLLSRPAPRRLYLRILHEYTTTGYWNPTIAGPFLDRLQRDVGIGTGGIKSFLASSDAVVRTQIQSSTAVPFQITTNNGNDWQVDAISADLEGDAPAQVAIIQYQHNDGAAQPLSPLWITPTHWKAAFALPSASNRFVLIGFDGAGEVIGADEITVRTTVVPVPPTVTAWFPAAGPAAGGTNVTFFGTDFTAGAKVIFGDADSTSVTVQSAEMIIAVAPAAALPLPPDGKVDLELLFVSGDHLVLPRAFTYTGASTRFIRGDANGDGDLNIADPLAALLHLFNGRSLDCADGADFDDNGKVEVADAVLSLHFQFLKGPPPPAPYPGEGPDPTSDSLDCSP